MKSGSNLERVILSGNPAVTAELGPPMSAAPDEIVHKAHLLRGFCDAANITDCQTAVVRISSIAAAFIAQREGLEPVMQMTCRDRNRIAMQADLLGAAALGLKNCLCIAGDHQKFGAAGKLKGHPGRKTSTTSTPLSSSAYSRRCATKAFSRAETSLKYHQNSS